MLPPLTLYYGHDPMCSFCWAFRPTWAELKATLKAQAPTIQIQYVMGGLAPDTDEIMPKGLQEKITSTWRHIEKTIPDTRFNYDFWTSQQPRRSTYPACRAVFAVKLIDRSLEDEMIHAIQEAYYLNAQNPSDNETLIGCAQTIGLNPDTFSSILEGEACYQGFEQERLLAQSIGVSSFPSLVLVRDNNRFNIPINYNRASTIFSSIERASGLLNKQ